MAARASQGNQTENSQGAGETASSWFAVDGNFPPGVPPCSTRRGHWEHLTERGGPKFEPLRSGQRPRLYNSGTFANGSALHPFLPALVPGKQTCPWAESLWLLRHYSGGQGMDRMTFEVSHILGFWTSPQKAMPGAGRQTNETEERA